MVQEGARRERPGPLSTVPGVPRPPTAARVVDDLGSGCPESGTSSGRGEPARIPILGRAGRLGLHGFSVPHLITPGTFHVQTSPCLSGNGGPGSQTFLI